MKIINTQTITEKEGYEAMLYMLIKHWKNSVTDDITEIFSGGEYIEEDTPANPELWKYWLEAIEKVRKDGPLSYQKISKYPHGVL